MKSLFEYRLSQSEGSKLYFKRRTLLLVPKIYPNPVTMKIKLIT